jgi:hypothetical protein
MITQADLQKVEQEIEVLRKEYNKLEKSLSSLINEREKLEKEFYKDKMDDIEWLINNPDKSGTYEARKEWLRETYGDEYRGVGFGGFYRNTNQTAVEFKFFTYGSSTEENEKNVKHFIENYLNILKPSYENKVMFQCAVGEHQGILYMTYDTLSEKWGKMFQRYGRLTDEEEFKDLETAIAVIQKFSKRIESDE